MRRAFLRGVLLVAVLSAWLAPAASRAEYPERAITLVVNFAAGGGTDVVARLLAVPLAEVLGRPVVVENRIGGGGNVGALAVARAQPDGYTLLVSSSAFVVNPSLSRGTSYDPAGDFAPVINVGVSPNVIAVRADSPMRSLADLIAEARRRSLNYASPGVGTTPHLAGEVLKQRTGIEMVHIPYAGGGPATQSVVAGTTDVLVANLSNLMGFLADGAMRALVQTDRERWPDLPGVPTLADEGIRDAETNIFIAFFAPAQTPQPIVERLARELRTILGRPEIARRMLQIGVAPADEGPSALAARVTREVAHYRQIIQAAGIAPK